jgi:hypothetical protein
MLVFYFFSTALPILLKIQFICFLSFLFKGFFFFNYPDYSPPIYSALAGVFCCQYFPAVAVCLAVVGSGVMSRGTDRRSGLDSQQGQCLSVDRFYGQIGFGAK